MITDSHLHIGQFYDTYTTPRQLMELVDGVGIDRFVVSSTTACIDDHEKILNEMAELKHLANDRVLAALWVTPQLLANDGLSHYLESGIRWECVKFHPYFHPYWTEKPERMEDVVTLARALHAPILLHTGESPSCYPHLFEELMQQHPEQIFILAHSRPIEETLTALSHCPNAYCDTAFTPIEHVVRLVNAGLADRVLWGSDLPIPHYFDPHLNLVDYCTERLRVLKYRITGDDFEKITRTNFERIFR